MRRLASLVASCLLPVAAVVHAAPVTSLYVHPSGGAGAGFSGQFFEFADEFTVPAGQTWRIVGVINDGYAQAGPNYQITFYNAAGATPGSVNCSRTGLSPRGVFDTNINKYVNPEYRLGTPCVLGAGNYFFAPRTSGPTDVQVSTTPTIAGNEMRIRSTVGSTCGTSFVPVSSCIGGPQDLRFTVRGCQAANCEFPIAATADCAGSNLVVAITDGDGSFNVTGSGPGLPRNGVGEGQQSFTGPGLWQNVAVVETSGDTQSLSLGFRNCGPRTTAIVESGGTTDVDEGNPAATDSYTIVLESSPNPGETVTITPSSNTTLGVTTAPANLQFTSDDWNVPKTITVTVVDDGVLEPSPHTYDVAHALTATAGGVFVGASVASVTVNIIDDDEVVFLDGFE